MKALWSEVRVIELFLSGGLPPAEALVFEARLITDRQLRSRVRVQKMVYSLIHRYARREMKMALEQIHDQFIHSDAHPTRRMELEMLFGSR